MKISPLVKLAGPDGWGEDLETEGLR
jgi:hypothetical protein